MGLVGDLLGNAALPHDATTCGGLLLGTFERFQRRVLLLPIDQATNAQPQLRIEPCYNY